MSQSTVMGVFRQVIELILPGLEIIYSGDDQADAPRPNVDPAVASYAAFEIQDDSSYFATAYEETTDTAAPDNKYVQNRSMPTEGTLAIEFYGPGAIDYARTLRLAHGRADVLALLSGIGDYTIEQPSQVTRDPVLRSATREPGASLTFVVRWVDSETYDVEAVEQIVTTVSVT